MPPRRWRCRSSSGLKIDFGSTRQTGPGRLETHVPVRRRELRGMELSTPPRDFAMVSARHPLDRRKQLPQPKVMRIQLGLIVTTVASVYAVPSHAVPRAAVYMVKDPGDSVWRPTRIAICDCTRHGCDHESTRYFDLQGAPIAHLGRRAPAGALNGRDVESKSARPSEGWHSLALLEARLGPSQYKIPAWITGLVHELDEAAKTLGRGQVPAPRNRTVEAVAQRLPALAMGARVPAPVATLEPDFAFELNVLDMDEVLLPDGSVVLFPATGVLEAMTESARAFVVEEAKRREAADRQKEADRLQLEPLYLLSTQLTRPFNVQAQLQFAVYPPDNVDDASTEDLAHQAFFVHPESLIAILNGPSSGPYPDVARLLQALRNHYLSQRYSDDEWSQLVQLVFLLAQGEPLQEHVLINEILHLAKSVHNVWIPEQTIADTIADPISRFVLPPGLTTLQAARQAASVPLTFFKK